MTLRLTRVQLEQVGAAVRLLSSPMEHASVEAWRSAVNRLMKQLLHADTAGFILPVPDGPLLYTEDHDASETAKFGDLVPPDTRDGTPVWARAIQLGVCTIDSAYDGDAAVYYRSAYYNEYAKPNDAAQTLAALMTLGGCAPTAAAALQLWRGRKNTRRFAQDDIGLLRLLFPALQAGVENYVRYGSDSAALLRTCDDLGAALLICDTHGRVVHRTPALDQLLALDPQANEVRVALARLAASLALAPAHHAGHARSPTSDTRHEMRTHAARYVLRCSAMRASWTTGPWIMVSLERLTPPPSTAADLQAMFGLSPAESRVAILLIAGRSAKEMAADLGLSWSTVRRHTERIYAKVNVSSRAQLIAKL